MKNQKSKEGLGFIGEGLILKALFGGLLMFGGYKLVKAKIDDGKIAKGEQEEDTPEGKLAQQLATEFDKWGSIKPTTYESIMSRVTPAMSDKVFTVYNKLTGRRLSADIRAAVSAKTQQRTTKLQQWNANEYSTINVVDNEIVVKAPVGSFIRFTPGQTVPISMYKDPEDIKENKVATSLKPSSLMYKVLELREVEVWDWIWQKGEILPISVPIHTYKKFVMAQINISVTKTPIRYWVNITQLITEKPHAVSGLDGFFQGLGEIDMLKLV